MVDFILGVPDPLKWHSEVSFKCIACACVCLYMFSLVEHVLYLIDFNFLYHTTKNLKLNKAHYASWMVHLGGARLVLLSLSLSLALSQLLPIFNVY